jgi:hypothetical protein
MREDKVLFPVIEVPASGNPKWNGGVYCIMWVYSTEGNFMLKGFEKECVQYITSKNWKCWVVVNAYYGLIAQTNRIAYWRRPSATPGYSTSIQTFNCDFNIYYPQVRKNIKKRGKKSAADFKYSIYFKFGNKALKLKRLPKVFVELLPPKS